MTASYPLKIPRPRLNTAEQIESRLDVYLETEFSARGSTIDAARELSVFTREQQEFVLHWVEIMASTNIEMAYQFSERAASVLRNMSEQLIGAWKRLWWLYAMWIDRIFIWQMHSNCLSYCFLSTK